MLLCIVLSLLAGSQEPEDLPVLGPGELLQGEISESDLEVHTELLDRDYADSTVRGELYQLQVDETGPYHVDMRSYDFDAYLILRDGFGEVLTEEDEGWVLSHARLAIAELRAGEVYWLEACAVGGRRGAFELRLVAGAAPTLSPEERAKLEAVERIRTVEAEWGEGTTASAGQLNNLALSLSSQGRFAAARPLHERALAIFEETLGAAHPNVAMSLNNLGNLSWDQGFYADAQSFHERALAIREEAFGSEHPEVATSMHNLGILLSEQGLHAEARLLYERALAIREEALGAEHPDVATSLNNLGNLLWDRGLYAEARPLHERALAIWERALGAEHPDVAASLSNLANLLWDQGLYAEARPLYERALAILEGALGAEHPDVGNTLNNLANLLNDQGLFGEARPLYERALAVREKARGAEHPDVALSLNNLADLLSSQGLHAEARPLFERALAIRESAFGAEHADVGRSLTSLGKSLGNQGLYSEAQAAHERALAILEKALGAEHPSVARSRNFLGDVLRDQGLYLEAQPLYERALVILEKALGAEHPDVATNLNNLAILLMDSHQEASAWELVRRAQAGKRAHLRAVLAFLSEQEAYLYLARSLWQLEFLLSLSRTLQTEGAMREAYAAVLDWKGQVARLLDASRARIRSRTSPEQDELLRALRSVQSQLSAVFSNERVVPERRLENVDRLVSERNELELRWQRSIDIESGAPPSFERIVESLPPGSALVDFFVHRVYRPAEFEGETFVSVGRWTKPRISVWISRFDATEPVYLDLGSVHDVQPKTRGFLENLIARRGARVERTTPEPSSAASGFPWHALEPHLDGLDRLFISPDGFLGAFPFEALQLDDGSYLIERLSVVYAQDIEALQGTDDTETVRSSLLSVGGVNFTHGGETDSDRQSPEPAAARSPRAPDSIRGYLDSWDPLPFTEYESQVVFELHEANLGRAGSRLLLQNTLPTEERLKHELPLHAYLHLATHGYFQPEGTVSLWDEARERRTGEGSQRRLIGHHPGLLSGLICAGVNAPARDGRDDGLLTAEEVSWLDLSGVELVVLSACETGLGEARSGEGLIGLRRAFRTAGAKTVISALWSVEDRSTSELMRAFYENLWLRGMTKGEALREAQLEMLRKNRVENDGEGMPSTWGAFVLSGDWQ